MLQFCASSKVDDDLLFSVDASEKPSEGRSWEATSNEIVFVCFCSFRFSKWRKKNLLSSSPMSAMDHIVTPSKVEIGYFGFKRERILTKLISASYSAAVERKKIQRRKNRIFRFLFAPVEIQSVGKIAISSVSVSIVLPALAFDLEERNMILSREQRLGAV